MRKLNTILGIIIIILVVIIFNLTKYDNTDVNKDGETNALDLLIVQKTILNNLEKEGQ